MSSRESAVSTMPTGLASGGSWVTSAKPQNPKTPLSKTNFKNVRFYEY